MPSRPIKKKKLKENYPPHVTWSSKSIKKECPSLNENVRQNFTPRRSLRKTAASSSSSIHPSSSSTISLRSTKRPATAVSSTSKATNKECASAPSSNENLQQNFTPRRSSRTAASSSSSHLHPSLSSTKRPVKNAKTASAALSSSSTRKECASSPSSNENLQQNFTPRRSLRTAAASFTPRRSSRTTAAASSSSHLHPSSSSTISLRSTKRPVKNATAAFSKAAKKIEKNPFSTSLFTQAPKRSSVVAAASLATESNTTQKDRVSPPTPTENLQQQIGGEISTPTPVLNTTPAATPKHRALPSPPNLQQIGGSGEISTPRTSSLLSLGLPPNPPQSSPPPPQQQQRKPRPAAASTSLATESNTTEKDRASPPTLTENLQQQNGGEITTQTQRLSLLSLVLPPNPQQSSTSPSPPQQQQQQRKPRPVAELIAEAKAYDEETRRFAQRMYDSETHLIQEAYRIKYTAIKAAKGSKTEKTAFPDPNNVNFKIREKDRIFSGIFAAFQPKDIFESSDEEEEQ